MGRKLRKTGHLDKPIINTNFEPVLKQGKIFEGRSLISHQSFPTRKSPLSKLSSKYCSTDSPLHTFEAHRGARTGQTVIFNAIHGVALGGPCIIINGEI